MLIVRGVNVFPTQIEEQILRDKRLSGNYQIVLTRDGNLDKVAVRCELQQGAQLSADEVQKIRDWLQHRIKTLVGITTKVDVLEYGSIERTQVGKARRVIDQRPR